VLLFLYITALAVLLGAELNATLDLTREDLAGEDRARDQRTTVSAIRRRTGRFDTERSGAKRLRDPMG